jgi:hypothetical protein
MKIFVQSSKLLNIFTLLILVGLIVFQTNNLSSLSSEVDDIGIYHTLVEAQQRKKEFYQRVDTSSKLEIINEIEIKGDAQAKKLALYLQTAHILEPTLKFIAYYKSLYAVPIGWTYAPGQYFITQLLVNGDESYQAAKLKIRAVSKFFWLLGIIGIIVLISKLKDKKINQAGLLFLVLIICSQSQTSYSAHGSSYAAGLFASSIAMLVTVKLFKSEQLSIPDILLLLVVTVIQYQLIPLVLLIFIISWLRVLFFDNLIKKDKAQSISNLIRCSLLFALLFLSLVFPTFKDKLGSGLNWNVGSNKEYSLNDNYHDLFHEVTFQKLMNLIIEPLNACIDTFASIFSPMHFSSLSVNLVGLPIIALIFIAFANLSKYKLIKPYLAASATILILHFFLYVLGVIPFSPTRHSLYLTVPLTVIGVVGINHLIFTYEILYPKLINPIFSLIVLILALAVAYLNISYILERKDPFDEVKVVELLTSRETPTIILNSDWTYQHYEMQQIQQVKILLDLNLSSKRDQFREQLEKVRPIIGAMNNGENIHLMRVSHWRPLSKDNTQEEITDIICKHFKYNCILKNSHELFSSTKKVSSEWVENIQGFSNSLYIDTLSISVLNSSSKD